jgi:hypothetical protein
MKHPAPEEGVAVVEISAEPIEEEHPQLEELTIEELERELQQPKEPEVRAELERELQRRKELAEELAEEQTTEQTPTETQPRMEQFQNFSNMMKRLVK